MAQSSVHSEILVEILVEILGVDRRRALEFRWVRMG
jgi:hypothetical protein